MLRRPSVCVPAVGLLLAAALSVASGQSALTALAALEVKGRAPKSGYDRDAFGYRAVDLDRNGCDTRNDILRRDLASVALKARHQ
ncbi:hypothetical protein ACWFNE_20325 [Cellulomonas sp. NPDC055163]